MTTEPAPQPLTPAEERTWRTLMRLMMLLPRALDEDLSRRTALGLTRYVVLMRLSEAPEYTLRMSDLAEAVSISPSRMTRIVQSMVSEGLVTRRAAPSDGRASLATLTEKGLHKLQEAWPAHLAGTRRLAMDHIEPRDLASFNRMTEQLLRAVEDSVGFSQGKPWSTGKAGDAEPGAA